MELIPVESSHVAEIGYIPKDRVLMVRYKDGSLYARPGVSQNIFDGLVKAHSKGAFLNAMPKLGSILITKGVMPNKPESAKQIPGDTTAPADNAPPSAGVLNVLTEEADKCCRKSVGAFIERWPAAKLASCAECGTDFVPEMVGAVRHWRVQPLVLIHRRED